MQPDRHQQTPVMEMLFPNPVWYFREMNSTTCLRMKTVSSSFLPAVRLTTRLSDFVKTNTNGCVFDNFDIEVSVVLVLGFRSKFQLLSSHDIMLSEALTSDPLHSELLQKISGSVALREKVLLRSTSLQVPPTV